MIVSMDRITALSDQIAREFHPERIILFGSYAYGEPAEYDDVDLMVVLPFEGTPARKCLEVWRAIHPGFPLDLRVRTPQHIRERLEMNDNFIREIVERGKVLYETGG